MLAATQGTQNNFGFMRNSVSGAGGKAEQDYT